jgi:succinoglycan biosynthesis transport protein ExoP
VITSASRPLAKTYPKSKLVLMLAILVGLVIGVAVGAARAMLDGSVRSARQLRQTLGLSVLGLLPRGRPEPAGGAPTEDRVEVLDAPLSPLSEALRDTKISIQHVCGGRSGYALGILSLLSDEAASTVAINLAALFEASGTKTLLIDADLRDRRLTRRLAPDATIGLAEALRGGPADVLLYERKTKTRLLPAAAATAPIADSADLLDSPALPVMLGRLKEEFGTILVHLPPLRRGGDARVAAPLLDGCILVCTYGRTPLRALEEAVDLLRAHNVVLFGVVMTNVSEDIPPLFGWHLSEIRALGYVEFARRLTRLFRERGVRGAWR